MVEREPAPLPNLNRKSLNDLWPAAYEELRRAARQQLLRERPEHTLQPTALVHEVYLRLLNDRQASWETKSAFLQAAAQTMRRILVDHARRFGRQKRGGHRLKLSLEDAIFVAEYHAPMLLEVDECLHRLSELDPRQAQIVELRYFAGLTVDETAEALGLSARTVKREWNHAKTWLYGELVNADVEQHPVAKSQNTL